MQENPKPDMVGKIAIFVVVATIFGTVMAYRGRNTPAVFDAPPAATMEVSKNPVPEVQQPAEKKLPQHFYALKDGDEYGYEPDISANQKNAGQVTSSLVMFRYAGEKKGKYQIFTSNANTRMVADCERPCEFVRARTFVNGYEVGKERLRRVEGSILYYALDDAMNGRMDQHFVIKNGKRLTLWHEG